MQYFLNMKSPLRGFQNNKSTYFFLYIGDELWYLLYHIPLVNVSLPRRLPDLDGDGTYDLVAACAVTLPSEVNDQVEQGFLTFSSWPKFLNLLGSKSAECPNNKDIFHTLHRKLCYLIIALIFFIHFGEFHKFSYYIK